MKLKKLIKDTYQHILFERLLDQSAKLGFYFLLSILPLLLFLVTVLGYILQSKADLKQTIFKYLISVIPVNNSTMIKSALDELASGADNLKISLSVLITWWTASKAMLAIIEELNGAYGVEETRPWWKRYFIASVLTMVALLLFSCVILLLIYGGRLSDTLIAHFGLENLIVILWQGLQWVLLFSLVMLTLNLIYVYGPNIDQRQKKWIRPGTIVGAVLWFVFTFGFKIYLMFFDRYKLVYGSIGVVIILLLWFYLSGVSILIGGAVNAEYEKSEGSFG